MKKRTVKDTLKHTQKKHSMNTPPSSEKRVQRKSPSEMKTDDGYGRSDEKLPDEILDLLDQMGWDDDLRQVSIAYHKKPAHVLGWARHACKKKSELKNPAVFFRKRMLSESSPPKGRSSDEDDRQRYVCGKYADFIVH